jgi:hypothetical protein
MEWILEHVWAQYTIGFVIILFFLTLVAFGLAAFESEHYLNSPFRGGKKITFKRALKNYLIGLYLVVILIGGSLYGIIVVFKVLDLLPIILISVGVPIIALVTAYINSKNEKYMFLKIKEFIEGFLTIMTVLSLIVGVIGYYLKFLA